MIANKIDTNKDGVITKDELKAWIAHTAKRFVLFTLYACPTIPHVQYVVHKRTYMSTSAYTHRHVRAHTH